MCKIEQQLTAASRRLAASVLLRARCLQHRNFASPFVFGSRSLFRLRFLPFMLSVSVSPFNLNCCCCCCFCRALCVWEKCNEIVRCPLAVNVLALVIGGSETGASTHKTYDRYR